MYIGEGGRFGSNTLHKRVTGADVTLNDTDHPRPDVCDLACQIKGRRQAEHKRPESDALYGSGDLHRQARQLAHRRQSAPCGRPGLLTA